MRFFYALIVFLLSSYLFFWGYIFAVPTPRLYIVDDLKTEMQADEKDPRFMETITRLKEKNKGTIYYFESNIQGKQFGALVLYAFFAFVVIFFSVILFHKKNYILFPLIAAVTLVLISCSTLWMLTNSIPVEIYLDLQSVREQYPGVQAFQFLNIYIFMECLILAVGKWYKIP